MHPQQRLQLLIPAAAWQVLPRRLHDGFPEMSDSVQGGFIRPFYIGELLPYAPHIRFRPMLEGVVQRRGGSGAGSSQLPGAFRKESIDERPLVSLALRSPDRGVARRHPWIRPHARRQVVTAMLLVAGLLALLLLLYLVVALLNPERFS